MADIIISVLYVTEGTTNENKMKYKNKRKYYDNLIKEKWNKPIQNKNNGKDWYKLSSKLNKNKEGLSLVGNY